MIENIGSYNDPCFILTCDNCGEEITDYFDSFEEALEWKQSEGKEWGWTSTKEKGVWEDRCPTCNPYKNESSKNRKPIKRRG